MSYVEIRRSVIVLPEKAETVIKTAVAEYRCRTLDHIAMPRDEAITLEMIHNKLRAGYNIPPMSEVW